MDLDPKFTMAELDLGKTLMRLGDVQGAATVLERLTARVRFVALLQVHIGPGELEIDQPHSGQSLH